MLEPEPREDLAIHRERLLEPLERYDEVTGRLLKVGVHAQLRGGNHRVQ